MTERDKADIEEVERWNATQAARAMAAGGESPSLLADVLATGSHGAAGLVLGRPRRMQRVAAVLVIAAGIAAFLALRIMLSASSGSQAAHALANTVVGSPSEPPGIHPAAGQPGQRCAAIHWRTDQGGNGHWYQVVSLGRNLAGAEGPPIQGVLGVDGALRIARESGADLVTIHSQAEHDFIHGLVAARYPRYRSFRILTGGIRTANGYAWRNGEPFDFDLTSPAHPIHPPGSPIVIGTGPDNAWCPGSPTGCWMTYPADQAWALHLAVLEWSEDCESVGSVTASPQ